MAWDDDEDSTEVKQSYRRTGVRTVYPVTAEAPDRPFKKFVPNAPRDDREPFFYGYVRGRPSGLLNEVRADAYFALTYKERSHRLSLKAGSSSPPN